MYVSVVSSYPPTESPRLSGAVTTATRFSPVEEGEGFCETADTHIGSDRRHPVRCRERHRIRQCEGSEQEDWVECQCGTSDHVGCRRQGEHSGRNDGTIDHLEQPCRYSVHLDKVLCGDRLGVAPGVVE